MSKSLHEMEEGPAKALAERELRAFANDLEQTLTAAQKHREKWYKATPDMISLSGTKTAITILMLARGIKPKG